ncbi:hypothetical protein [Crocinitomix algicola]|uniref:hypothetical protein n=1 Tax=Crocinitomix algicola TaxID=1740263 RepID=UPI000872274A|nr:hypothetical protein [Crocinitomix algicola]
MYTKKKSKWFPLISIGLLMVILPNIIEHLSSWHISDLAKGLLIGIGVGFEILGLLLIRKDRLHLKKS